MAPLNLFSHRIDPKGVLEVLRDFGDLRIDGDEDNWSSAILSWKRGFFGKHELTIGHNVEYYSGSGWPRQVAGMQGYFSTLPAGPALKDAMKAIASFCFALSLPDQEFDLLDDEDDPRLPVIFAVAKHLDAVLFQPGFLFDAAGRVLLAPDGDKDPSAIAPESVQWTGAEVQDDGYDAQENDEDGEPLPPEADKVMRRAMVLAALSARALTENEGPEDIAQVRQELSRWVSELGLEAEMEPQEAAFMAEPGIPDRRAMLNAVWRVEGLAVLAWALGLQEIPRHDELATPPALWDSLGVLDLEKARERLAGAKLRPKAELDALRAKLLAFHWRMTDFRVRPRSIDFEQVASQGGWFEKLDLSSFELVDQDLALSGVPLIEASEDDVSSAGSAAVERHLAINWLGDAREVYSETDVST